MKTNFSSLLFWLLLLRIAHADLILRERLVDWTPGVRTGVIGGIPANRTHLINVTQSPYKADNTGATDASSAIQAAINKAGPGAVVYLPAGTYRIQNTVTLGPGFSGKTLRGAGPDLTIIDQRASTGLVAGSLSGLGPPQVTPMRVVSGMAKGNTSVKVSPNTDNLAVGQLFFFMVQSDLTLPVASVYNYDVFTDQAPTNQQVRIVSKTSNTITFTPPLMDDYGAGGLAVRITRDVAQGTGIGIEDLTVDAANARGAYSAVQMASCYGSWIKNCKILHALNYTVAVTYSLNCEIRHCTITGTGGQHTNGAGILFGGHSCLVEDNIITDAFPIIEVNGGSAGNVFAYNYGPPDGMWNTNHAPHNQFNLYEGNAAGFQMSDGYFGSEANLTIFRNYFHGPYGINLRRFNRKTSAVGNILDNVAGIGADGLPNMGNGEFNGTAQLSAGHPWRDWRMTATVTGRTDDDHGEITLNSGRLFATQVMNLIWGTGHDQQMGGNVISVAGNVVQITRANTLVFPPVRTEVLIGPGAFSSTDPSTGAYVGSYQEKDLDVAATLIRKGNRYTTNNSFDSLDGDTLPDSLFRTNKPSWFGNLAWPPYDPVTPRTPKVTDIPAGYRFVHGTDPPTPAPIPGETLEPQPTDLPLQDSPSATPEPKRINLPPQDSPSATPEAQQKVQKKWTKSKKGKNWTGKKNSANETSETPGPMGKN